MTTLCRSPLGIENQFSLLNHCQECINLRESNSKLEIELERARLYAQQCEDEAVELRRQLCAALKDLSKMRKLIDDPSRKSSSKPLSQLSDNVQLETQSSAGMKPSTDQNNPVGMVGVLYTAQCKMEESPDIKRKVVRAEQHEPDSAKRQRTVDGCDANESMVPVEVEMDLHESIELIQDIVAVWTQRIQAMQRIECLLSNSATLVSAEASDRLFKGFAAQVDLMITSSLLMHTRVRPAPASRCGVIITIILVC
jgi:hypothetical protein